MASSSKQMDMPVLFLISGSGLILLAAGIVFAQGLYLQGHQAARFSPETAGITLSQRPGEASDLLRRQDAVLQGAALTIEQAMQAEIDAAAK